MMRLLLRLILLIMTLVGIGLAFVMPWAAERQGYEMGRWLVYDRTGGFSDVSTQVSGWEKPAVILEIHTLGPMPYMPGALLTVTATIDATTVLAHAVDLVGVSPGVLNPQTGEHLYRLNLGPLPSAAEGDIRFRFAPGDAEIGRVLQVNMILTTRADSDPRLLPVGYVLLVVGFVGLVTSFRSRKPPVKVEPPPPKWGRG